MDVMKIQENLEWDNHIGNLIGYADFEEVELSLQHSKTLLMMLHFLVFLVSSVVDPCKCNLENFTNTDATPSQMFPLLWKAFNSCEINALKTSTANCDGASPNRK